VMQFGPTLESGLDGRYRFGAVPAGEYTLVVEVPGKAPVQHTLKVAVGERGQPMPELVFPVEVPM